MKYLLFFLIIYSELNAAFIDKIVNNSATKYLYRSGDQVKIDGCDKAGWCKIKGIKAYVKKSEFEPADSDSKILVKTEKKPSYLYLKKANLSKRTIKKLLSYYKKKLRKKDLKAFRLNYKKKYVRLNTGAKKIFQRSLGDKFISKIISSPKIKYRYRSGNKVRIDKCKSGWCKLKGIKAYVKKSEFRPLKSKSKILVKKKKKKPSYLYLKKTNLSKKSIKELLSYYKKKLRKKDLKRLKANYKKKYMRFTSGAKKALQKNFAARSASKNKTLLANARRNGKNPDGSARLITYSGDGKKRRSFYSGIFAVGYLGSSSANIQFDKELTELKKSTVSGAGFIGDVGVGYYITPNFFSTFSRQLAFYANNTIDNIYFSLNYQASRTSLKPYFGLLIDYSELAWTTSPIADQKISNDLISNKFGFGIQAGLEYSLDNNYALTFLYQLMINEHKTIINDKELIHSGQQNILFGLKYILN
jgi:hypothetical protein